MLQLVSYNLNGIRSALDKGLIAWLSESNIDLFCVQETKAQFDQIDFTPFEELGYFVSWAQAEKKGYSGVATFSKIKPDLVVVGCGIEKYDCEGRIIRTDFGDWTLLNCYFPSGTTGDVRQDFKMDFLSDFSTWLQSLLIERPRCIVVGDLNIAPTKNDTSHPEVFENENHREGMPGVTKHERNRFQAIIQEADLIDAWKLMNGHENKNEDELYNIDGPNFTWRGGIGKYHLMGMRLDHVFVSSKFREKIVDAKILGHSVNMTGFLGSDHCPIKVIVQKN